MCTAEKPQIEPYLRRTNVSKKNLVSTSLILYHQVVKKLHSHLKNPKAFPFLL